MVETISIIIIINNKSIYKGFLDSLNNQDFKKRRYIISSKAKKYKNVSRKIICSRKYTLII